MRSIRNIDQGVKKYQRRTMTRLDGMRRTATSRNFPAAKGMLLEPDDRTKQKQETYASACL